jgi:hypothetical protein
MFTRLSSALLVFTALVAPGGASAHRPADRCGTLTVVHSSVPPDVLIYNPAGPAAFDQGSQGLFETPGPNTFGERRGASACPPRGQS